VVEIDRRVRPSERRYEGLQLPTVERVVVVQECDEVPSESVQDPREPLPLRTFWKIDDVHPETVGDRSKFGGGKVLDEENFEHAAGEGLTLDGPQRFGEMLSPTMGHHHQRDERSFGGVHGSTLRW
jgi:hypothetical protein